MFVLLINRMLYGLAVLLLVIIIVSAIVYSAPVDPTRLTFGQRMDDETVALKRSELGLDQPLRVQLWLYLRDISPMIITKKAFWKEQYQGRFITLGANTIIGFKWPYLRESFQSGRRVADILKGSFPNTFILATSSLLLAIVIGIIAGIAAAIHQNSWIDNLIVTLATLGYSVPSYVTAIILSIIFGYYLRDFSGLNIQGSLLEIDDFGNDKLMLKNLLLPIIALGIRPISIITQLMRSSVIQVMSEKYVLAARAKGLSQWALIRKHVLQNAFNPVLTALSGWFAALLAGAFFVEYIFNFKGLGFVTVTALLNYDIPVILGALLLTCSLFILINIAVDLLYAVIDPRIKISQ